MLDAIHQYTQNAEKTIEEPFIGINDHVKKKESPTMG